MKDETGNYNIYIPIHRPCAKYQVSDLFDVRGAETLPPDRVDHTQRWRHAFSARWKSSTFQSAQCDLLGE